MHAVETDLAELINQLSDDTSSHILVPAIHRNRAQIAALFRRELGVEVSDEPAELTAAARAHLRAKFLSVPVGVSGANFAVAETGHVVVLESEGNGRMCTTLPEVLVSVVGIEKILPRWRDLEVMLQLLPRSSTGERMNPYTSIWSGVADGDGPREFHLVLLDAGRTDVLADEVGRAALRCIRCSACLNVCPVYERTGGHAYESVYPGPIGAILTPQLQGLENAPTLPWASSLCGACYEVCPVKIDIPSILVHLRGRVVREVGAPAPERAAMAAMARVFAQPPRLRGRAARGQARARAAGRRRAARRGRARASCPRCPSRPSGTGGAAASARDDILGARARRAARRAGRRGARAAGLRAAAAADRRRRSRASPSASPTTARRCARPTTSPRPSRRCAPSTTPARLGVPPGLLEGWRPDGIELVEDHGLSARDLDALDGALTGCALAIAETGTIVLDGGERSGRRALTLVPDLHVCVVERAQVVATVPEAIRALDGGRGPFTFVSGPSATSDIELDRVEGVHGPRRLEVLLV